MKIALDAGHSASTYDRGEARELSHHPVLCLKSIRSMLGYPDMHRNSLRRMGSKSYSCSH